MRGTGITGLLALGLLLGHVAPVAAQRSERTLRADCTRDRCVYRDRRGYRAFAVEQLPPNRLRVTDLRGHTLAKVRRGQDGTVTIEESRKRR